MPGCEPNDYTVVARRTSYKEHEVTYREGGRRLTVELEMAGDTVGGWVGVDTALAVWTDPAGVSLTDAERVQVLGRLLEWGSANGKPLRFAPPLDWATVEASWTQRGWRRTGSTDAAGRRTVSYQAPPLQRVWWVVKRLLRRRDVLRRK